MSTPSYNLLRIVKASTAAQVAEAVAKLILEGELAPGARLPELEFASDVGVSRNTFREALRILERDGLVRHEAHRGAVVTALTAEDVRELFQIRTLLELAALDTVRKGSGPPSRSELRSAYDRMTNARGFLDALEADMAFHRELVGLMKSPRLNDFYATVQRELWLAMAQMDRRELDLRLDEHGAILDALDDGNLPGARKLLRRHLQEAGTLVERSLAAARARPSGSRTSPSP